MKALSSSLNTIANHEKIYQRLDILPTQITQFCQQWQITELALFGSILRNDFNEESDIDFLVVFAPEIKINLDNIYAIEAQLKNMTGRNIDLIFKKSIEKSDNWIRKNHILETAEVIYG